MYWGLVPGSRPDSRLSPIGPVIRRVKDPCLQPDCSKKPRSCDICNQCLQPPAFATPGIASPPANCSPESLQTRIRPSRPLAKRRPLHPILPPRRKPLKAVLSTLSRRVRVPCLLVHATRPVPSELKQQYPLPSTSRPIILDWVPLSRTPLLHPSQSVPVRFFLAHGVHLSHGVRARTPLQCLIRT
jgi:hypothetical protein